MYDIAIIGGGPAGLTAAIYARRAGKKTLLLEATACGGQMNNTGKVSNYPALEDITGPQLAQSMQKQAEDLGAEIAYDRIVRIEPGFKLVGEEDEYLAKAVIIATGTEPRKLGLDGEDRLAGISYCATCDGGFYKDKVVAVYGGGNSAVHEALYLSGVAQKVYLIHRREELRAAGDVVEKLRSNQKVEMLLGTNVTKLLGDKKLTGIELSSGKSVELDGLFVAIGREPKCDFCSDLATDGEGFIVADESCTTSIPGIFVAGDVRTKELRQIVTASADGAAAAEAAIKYLA
ncbi:FAD-dependent oxidoreductase [Candidatus Saccharibacteria bacterium]|nr:FAD-dependent oxidoreductase [Candidatus Saccharibacteria bacterium]